ncbi:MAG TPA: M48 family metallopeptidase [Acidimicrobiia bacterium]|nr:M48 family metallopeptidase [Acidimicrobiia bacterium]
MTQGRLSPWVRFRTDAGEWFDADEIRRGREYVRPLGFMRAAQWAIGASVALAFVEGRRAEDVIDGLGARGWIVQLVVVVAAIELTGLVFRPWFSAWRVFVHDRRWDLSTQGAQGWAADQVKGVLLDLALTSALMIPLYALMRTTDRWWVWGWLVFTAFAVLFGFLFPVVFAPIFNKFERLADPDLEARITRVADRAGLKIEGVYVANASVRSRATNAYVAGLGSTRRVVLFDTILAWPPALLEQVVAHELGHWRHGHLARQLPLLAVVQFAAFGAMAWVFSASAVLDWIGVAGPGDPRTLPFFLLVYPAILGGATLVLAWLSRAYERQADLHALSVLDDPAAFQAAFRRLAADNVVDVDPPWWQRIRHGHPPVPERMAMAAAWEARDEPRGEGDPAASSREPAGR